MTCLAAALRYLACGWSVIPIRPADKRPLIGWARYQQERPNEELVRHWFEQWPDAGIGIVTGIISGLFVLDADGETGAETLRELEVKHGPLETVEALTPGGGRHLYFRHPGGTIPNAVRFASGLDARADGGYVVAPPSVHPNSGVYAFDLAHHPDDTPLADAPAWLLNLVTGAAPVTVAPAEDDWQLAALRGVAQGARNDTAARLAGHFLNAGLPAGEVAEILIGWNSRNRPPLLAREVRLIVESIAKAEAKAVQVEAELVSWEAMLTDPNQVPWLLDGLLPDGGLAVMAGEGGDGKGWFALMAAAAITSGEAFLGEFHAAGAGGVIYVDAERGRRYMASRVKDITLATGRKPAVMFLFRPPKLDSQWLAALVEKHRPALLIVDSLSRLLPPGTKDTDNSAMSEVLGALRDIAERFGCCVLVIHHFKKRAEFADNRPVARVRGASSIVNVADVVIGTAKTKDGLLKIEVVKSYWGDPAAPFLCDWQGDPNGGTSLVYAGLADPESVTKVDLGMEVILDALASEPRDRKEIATVCKERGIGERSAFLALKELRGTGKVGRSTDGHKAVFALIAEDNIYTSVQPSVQSKT